MARKKVVTHPTAPTQKRKGSSTTTKAKPSTKKVTPKQSPSAKEERLKKERAVVLRARKQGKDEKLALKEYRERERTKANNKKHRASMKAHRAAHGEKRKELVQQRKDLVAKYSDLRAKARTLPPEKRKAAMAKLREGKKAALLKLADKRKKLTASKKAKLDGIRSKIVKHTRTTTSKKPAMSAKTAKANVAHAKRMLDKKHSPAASARLKQANENLARATGGKTATKKPATKATAAKAVKNDPKTQKAVKDVASGKKKSTVAKSAHGTVLVSKNTGKKTHATVKTKDGEAKVRALKSKK